MHHKTFKSSIGFPDPGKDADTFIDLDRLWAAVVRRANVIAASVIALQASRLMPAPAPP